MRSNAREKTRMTRMTRYVLVVVTTLSACVVSAAEIKRNGARGVVQELVWAAHRSLSESRVFMTTNAREVFYSSDNGKTFQAICKENVLRGCEELRSTPMLISRFDDDSVGDSDAAKEILIQDAGGKYIWASPDLGDTWRSPCEKADGSAGCFANPAKSVPGGRGRILGAIKPHPRRAGWFLAFVKTCDSWNPSKNTDCAPFRLLASGDFGKSWTDMMANSRGKIASFMDYDWGPDDGSSPTPMIYATAFRNAAAFTDHRDGWDYNIDLLRSNDLFASIDVVEQCANAFEILNGDVYSALPPDCEDFHKNRNRPSAIESSDVVLKISTDLGQTFNTACFPMNMPKNGFVIYDYHAGDAGPDFISVDHAEQNIIEAAAPMNKLYASDESLQLFSLSMKTLVRSQQSFAMQDFVPVYGLDGVFVANQISYKAFISGFPPERYSDFFESRISFNGGGTWHKIPAPETNAEGVKYQCSSDQFDCERYGLHLHGEVDWEVSEDWEDKFGGVYSRPSAPGIIISTGNVGDALTDDVSQVNTYISRDGGATWTETKRGAYIYEFGNHGGLLVIAKQFEPVDKVEYSLNEGKTWATMQLASRVFVHNIRVDPSAKGHVFIIHGATAADDASDPSRGSYFVINFDDILAEQKIKVCADGDYETWMPAAPGSGGCLLGQRVQLKRRKLSVECFNDGDAWREKQVVGTCACSRVYDTECDYGSERVYNIPNASDWPHCVTMSDVNTKCQARSHVSVRPSNLRIVSGDKCSGAAAVLGDDDHNDRHHHRRGHLFFRVLMFVTVFGVVVFGALYVRQNYDLGTLSTTFPNAARNAVNTAYDKVRDIFGKREHATPPGYFEPLGDFAAEDEI